MNFSINKLSTFETFQLTVYSFNETKRVRSDRLQINKWEINIRGGQVLDNLDKCQCLFYNA